MKLCSLLAMKEKIFLATAAKLLPKTNYTCPAQILSTGYFPALAATYKRLRNLEAIF